MIELSGGVAAAARSPAVRPRLGAGSLAAPGARAPTRSHGARGARRGPDPVPLAGGLRGLPGRRRGGGAAAGRVAVGRERPARPLRLQVPQPADHAHLRLLPALPGTGTARPASPSCARRGRTGARLQPRPQTSRPARPAVRCPSAGLRSPCARNLLSSLLRAPERKTKAAARLPSAFSRRHTKGETSREGAQLRGFQGWVCGLVTFPGTPGAPGPSEAGMRAPCAAPQVPAGAYLELSHSAGSELAATLRAPGGAPGLSRVFQGACCAGACWRLARPSSEPHGFKVLPIHSVERGDGGDTGPEGWWLGAPRRVLGPIPAHPS